MKEEVMIEEGKIDVGSVVRLKSGGPDMTVMDLRETGSRTEACCRWFTRDSRHHECMFVVQSLQLKFVAELRALMHSRQRSQMRSAADACATAGEG